jgi:3-dehydroquinate synthase
VIKYGVIWNQPLFEVLEECKRLDELRYLDAGVLQEILSWSCQSKADVVMQDEKESDLRAILNYGHTIGHAVESLTGYKSVIHGEAVAIGMVAASQLAVELEMWDKECHRRQLALIKKAGLPVKLPAGLDVEAIVESLQTDKKVKGGKVRFVLPAHIGAATVTDQVPAHLIRQVLRGMM